MRSVCLLALVVCLAACGADAERATTASPTPAMSADERAIRDTLDRYVKATRANDPRAVCAVTARELIDQIEALGSTCERFFADRLREGGPKFALSTTSVEIHGDRAMTRGRAGETDRPPSGGQPLVRENGRWLLTTKTG
jgi:hypothetical protein